MTAGDIVVIRGNANSKKGVIFDGTDDYVAANTHGSDRVTANDTLGTYTAWIYLNDLAGTYCILSTGDTNAAEYMQLSSKAGLLNVVLYQGAATQFDVIQTTANLTARNWHHVAVVQNGTRPTLYVDGAAVAMTDTTSTDLTMWYDELIGCDNFSIGILSMNTSTTLDYNGAIGQVKYWPLAMNAAQILIDYKGTTQPNSLYLDSAAVLNITMNEGVTDSGTGADNGTLTGGAYWAGDISDWSYAIARNASISGHAAEFINTIKDGSDYVTLIKMGD